MLSKFRKRVNKREYHSVNEYLFYCRLFIGMMLLYTLGRLVFYAFNTSLFQALSVVGFFKVLWGGVQFDLTALLYLNLPLIVFGFLPLPFKFTRIYQLVLKWLFLLINGLGLLLNGVDIIYYRFILKRTTASVFSILDNESNLGKLFFRFLFDFWYVALFIVFTWWLMYKLYGKIVPKPVAYRSRWMYYLSGVGVFVIVVVLAVGGMRGGYAHSTRPITLSNAADYVESPEQVAIVQNTPFCLIRTFGKKAFTHYEFYKSQAELDKVYTPITTFASTSPADSLPMNKKNVVVIILESFSREFFGSLNKDLQGGQYKGFTPFLDSLIAKSLVFPKAYANGRKSIDGLPSVIASIPSMVVPYVISEYSSNKINSLASILGKEGYQTAFFHGAPNGSMGFSAFTKIAGIQKYYGKNEFANDAFFDGMWGIWDEEFFQFYAQEQSKMQQPFYTTIFSVSSHHPFKVPERYEGKFPEGSIPVCKTVGYTDYSLRKYFETAKKSAWYNNTIFVITADHSTLAQFDEYRTSANAFGIPLIFFTPDSSMRGMSEKTAQQIDIMPTILDKLNYKGTFSAFGKSLLDSTNHGFAISFINENYQLIRNDTLVLFDGKKTMAAFDLAHDRLEQHNLVGKANLNEYEAFTKAFMQQYNNRMLEDRLTVK